MKTAPIAAPPDPLSYPWPTPPAGGEVRDVAPGVLWARFPLPFALDHVNVWLLADGDGWLAVDAAFNNADCRGLWQTLLGTVLDGKPLSRLLVTHMHPDHMGLAGWLVAETGAELLASQAEWLSARMLTVDHSEDLIASYRAFYRSAGVAEALRETLSQRGNAYKRAVVVVPPRYRRVRAGDGLLIGGRTWRVIVGEGHAPEQLCLYCHELNLLIAADQVLPRISPNISIWPSEPEADPLKLFLDSMARFADLPDDVLVLPSHGLPFRGLHRRLAALADHHADRLDETQDACRQPTSLRALVDVLFRRSLDPHQLMFAIGEAAAHANRLVEKGTLRRSWDADGVLRYSHRPAANASQ